MTWGDGTSTSRTAAQFETILRYRTPSVSLEEFGGGVSQSGATNLAAFDDAVAALASANPNKGGSILLGPGVYTFGGTLAFPSLSTGLASGTRASIEMFGAGRGHTQITRNDDFILLDLTGAHAATSTTARCTRAGVHNLTVLGGNSSFSTSTLRSWYAEKCLFSGLDFIDVYGRAIDLLEHWDSYFYGCFFGNVGGRDGNSPAIHLRQTDGSVSGLGHSSGTNVNNVWMMHNRVEGWRDGAYWCEGGGSDHNQLNRLIGFKFEQNTNDAGHRENSIRFHQTRNCVMAFGDFIASGRDATDTQAATDCVSISQSASHIMDGINFRMTSAGSTNIDTFVHWDGTTIGSNTLGTMRSCHPSSRSAGDKPITACFKYSGTNNWAVRESCWIPANSGAMTMWDGTPTSELSGDRLIKAGAPTDGDFPNTPPNGAQATDTTNSREYTRVGGTWKYAALT